MVDEWFAPVVSVLVLAVPASRYVSAARELIGLLDATSARPSANSVIGGVLALLIANWVPHLAAPTIRAMGYSALTYDPARPLNVLAWPFLCFVAVLMMSFVVQSLQFEKPGRTMAGSPARCSVVAYVGLLGSFIDPDAMV